MSVRVIKLPMRFCGNKLSIVLVAWCASAALPARADERPARPSGTRVAAAANRSPSESVADSVKTNEKRIEQLIHDLGSSNYSARRLAANEIRQIGAKAFDLLYQATDDKDPEVAASATYLLRQIPVRWL